MVLHRTYEIFCYVHYACSFIVQNDDFMLIAYSLSCRRNTIVSLSVGAFVLICLNP